MADYAHERFVNKLNVLLFKLSAKSPDSYRRRVGNLHDLVHKSPIGFMEPRKGGLPVKLTYFITPYDLIDVTQKSFIGLNVNSKYRGYSWYLPSLRNGQILYRNLIKSY